MTPIWLALPALVVFCALGAALEWLAGLRAPRAPLDAVAWISHGAALFVSFAVHPAVGVALLALSFASVRAARATVAPALVMGPARLALLVVTIAAVLIALQPPVPIAWDELVWLSRARVGAAGPLVLADRALDPEGGLLPSGYPIGAGALQAAFAFFRDDLRSLTGGTCALVVLTCAVFALTLAESKSVSRRVTSAVILAAPLAWVHLRTGMLDLPIGLLAGALALCLRGAGEGHGRSGRLALPIAILLASLKDEGAMYVVVIALLSLLPTSSRRALGPAALSSLVAALSIVGVWRLRLGLAGVAAEHHAPSGLSFDALGPVVRELVRAACDVRSFGGSLAVIAVAAAMQMRPSARPEDRALSAALLGCILATLAALAVGPDAVRTFAATGTLWPRFLVQLLPLGAVVVGAGWKSSAPVEGRSPEVGEVGASGRATR